MLERGIALLACLVVVLAGCAAQEKGGASPTTSSGAPAAKDPQTVVDKEVTGCPQGSGTPVQTAPATINFEVKAGYDTMIISFHEAGVGRRSASIHNVENQRTPIWERKEDNVNTLPTACGGHAHGGDGETKTVEAGNYTAKISYSGGISMHLSVIVKSSKANSTASPTTTHSHSSQP